MPKSIVGRMINEKATWRSFSGALTKVSKDRDKIIKSVSKLLDIDKDLINLKSGNKMFILTIIVKLSCGKRIVNTLIAPSTTLNYSTKILKT